MIFPKILSYIRRILKNHFNIAFIVNTHLILSTFRRSIYFIPCFASLVFDMISFKKLSNWIVDYLSNRVPYAFNIFIYLSDEKYFTFEILEFFWLKWWLAKHIMNKITNSVYKLPDITHIQIRLGKTLCNIS